MSLRLVSKLVTMNDLERIMALILRYFTEFGSFRDVLCNGARSLSHLISCNNFR